MFLSRDELIELTGFKQPSKQANWLQRQGIRYYVNHLNKPVVTKDALIQTQAATVEPNWSAR